MASTPSAPSTPPAPIAEPVGIVYRLGGASALPADPLCLMSDYEFEHFAPGSATENQYAAMIDNWEGVVMSVMAFPGAHLDRLVARLVAAGVGLARGVPVMISGAAISPYPAAARFRAETGLELGRRVYMFVAHRPGSPGIREDSLPQSLS